MGRYDDYDDDIDVRSIRRDEPLPHSGAGILSIILGIFTFFAFLAVILVAGLMEMDGRMVDENSPEAMVIGLLAFACLGGWLIGLVLGIVGTFQSQRSRVCGIIGLVINALLLVGVAGVLLLAVMMQI